MSWRAEQRIYFDHVRALFEPGRSGAVHSATSATAGTVGQWPGEDLNRLIDEGRRQHDRLYAELEQVRSRGQVLLATGLALLAATGAFVDQLSKAHSAGAWCLWVGAVAFGAWSVLGAAATVTVTAEMETIDATVLSTYSPPVDARLAQDYAEINQRSFDAVAVRLTNSRLAVGFLLIAAVLALGTWLALHL